MAAKNLVVFSDGTWQDLSQPFPTNVVRLLQAITPFTQDGSPQLVYYDEGVGAKQLESEIGCIDKAIKIFGGGFGLGINYRIQRCYRFLCLNYNPGDRIYLFGFSRGAYTVRSLAGLIYNCGLLRREKIRLIPKAYDIYRKPKSDVEYGPSGSIATDFRRENAITHLHEDGRPPIRFLGVWDTVKALGLPEFEGWLFGHIGRLFNNRYDFHDHKLSRIIEFAYHAVSIEEQRATFSLIPIDTILSSHQKRLEQSWFPGGHGGVGGGDANQVQLSDGALQWMFDKLNECQCGLDFDLVLIQPPPLEPDHKAILASSPSSITNLITKLFGSRPRIIPAIADWDAVPGSRETISSFARHRFEDLSGFFPENLERYLDNLKKDMRWQQLIKELKHLASSEESL